MSAADTLLWDRWRESRDAEAFAEIVARHSGTVFGACKRILRNTADAEDVAQDCFIELSRARSAIHSSLGAWLHTLAVRRALDLLRAEKRRRRHTVAAPKETETSHIPDTQELLQLVDRAIAELPEKLREPVVQRFLQGRTSVSVADDLAVSESTVRYRVERGVEQIRKFLKQHGVEVGAASLLATLSAKLLEVTPAALTARLGKIALAGAETAATTGEVAGPQLPDGKSRLSPRPRNTMPLTLVGAAAVLFVAAGVLVVQQLEEAPPLREPAPAVDPDGVLTADANDDAAPQAAADDEASTFVVSGTVRDAASGEPLAGAVVNLADATTTTGGDGSYTIDAPAPGEYELVASHGTYVTRRTTLEILTEGQNAYDLELEEAFVVLCVDDGGHALEGIEVRVAADVYLSDADLDLLSSERQTYGPIRTDSAGKAAFADLPRSPREAVGWRRTVFAYSPERFSGVSNVNFGAMSDGSLPDNPLRVVLAEPLEVRGTVKVPDGFRPEATTVYLMSAIVTDPSDPLRSVWLERNREARAQLWPEIFEVRPGEDGSFSLDGVPAGSRVYLAGEGPGLGQAQFMSNRPEDLREVILELGLEGVLEGSVTFKDTGEVAGGIALEASPQEAVGNREPLATTTDADGVFRFRGLAPGAYNIALPRRPRHDEWAMPVRGLVTVSAGETTGELRLQLERGALVSGVVMDAQSGQPLDGVWVTALNGPEHRQSAVGMMRTDERGRYTLRLPSGSSKLYLSGGAEGYKTRGVEVVLDILQGEVSRDGVDFRLMPSQRRPEMPTIEFATARGRVVDPDGNPLAGIRVAGREAAPSGDDAGQLAAFAYMRNPKRQDTTNEFGEYEVAVMAGRKFRVAASGKEYSTALSESFEIGAAEIHETEDLSLRRGTSFVEGQVFDPEGRPIDAVFVSVGSKSKSFSGPREPRTDGEGRFRFEHVMADEPLTVSFRKIGFARRNWNNVPPGLKNLRFVLHPLEGPLFHQGDKKPPKAKELLGREAPEWDVEQWVGESTSGARPRREDGRRTILMFSWSAGEWSKLGARLQELEHIAGSCGTVPVVIFAATAHESMLKRAVETFGLSLAMGIDRHVPRSEYAFSNATMLRYGWAKMPMVFVIDTDGIVRHVQSGLEGLKEAVEGI